jgi:hypothetical protein
MTKAEGAMPVAEASSDLARRAGLIARNAQLVAINLREIQATFVAEPDQSADAAKLLLAHEVRHSFRPKTDERPNELRVSAGFSVGVTSENDDEKLFRMTLTFELVYFLPANMPDEAANHFDAFCRTNAMVHVWPYFRETVQSTTWRMGLPPFPMPLFKIRDPSGTEAGRDKALAK